LFVVFTELKNFSAVSTWRTIGGPPLASTDSVVRVRPPFDTRVDKVCVASIHAFPPRPRPAAPRPAMRSGVPPFAGMVNVVPPPPPRANSVATKMSFGPISGGDA
jgi:hypothetical protein